jgi:hypothetical protein
MAAGLFGLIIFTAVGLAAAPASASPIAIGTLADGASYSDTISSNGPSFTQDYTFHLDSSLNGLTILATAFGQSAATFGVDMLTIGLYDSAHNLIADASGAPLAGLDSFAQSGVALTAGDYLLSILGDVTAGKSAFVSVSIAANGVIATSIPAAGILLLSGLGALGAAAWRRRRSAPPVA